MKTQRLEIVFGSTSAPELLPGSKGGRRSGHGEAPKSSNYSTGVRTTGRNSVVGSQAFGIHEQVGQYRKGRPAKITKSYMLLLPSASRPGYDRHDKMP